MDLVVSKRCVALAVVVFGILLRNSTATPTKRMNLFGESSGFPSSGYPPPPSPVTTTAPPPRDSLSTRPPVNRPSKIEQAQLKNETEQPTDVIYLIENLDPEAINNVTDVLARFKDAYNVSVNSNVSFHVDSENKTFEILKEDWFNNNENLTSVIIPITLDNSTISGGVFRQNHRRSRNLLKAVKGLIENGEGKLQYSGGLTAKQSLNLFGKVFHAVVHITYGKSNADSGSVESSSTSGSNEDDISEEPLNKITFSPTTEKELFELLAGVRGTSGTSQDTDETRKTVRHASHDENSSSSNDDTDESHDSESHGSASHESASHDSHDSESSSSGHSENDSHNYEGHSSYGEDSNGSPGGYSGSDDGSSHSDSGSDESVSENLNSYSNDGSSYESGSQSASGYESSSSEGFKRRQDTFRADDGVDEKNKTVTAVNNKTKVVNNKTKLVNKNNKNVLNGGKDTFMNDKGNKNKNVLSNKISRPNAKDREENAGGYSASYPTLTNAIPFINGSYIDDAHPNLGYYNIYNEPNLLFQQSGKFRLPNKNYPNLIPRHGNSSQDKINVLNYNNKFELGLNFGVIVNDTLSRTNNKFIEDFVGNRQDGEQNIGDQSKNGDDNDVNADNGFENQSGGLTYPKPQIDHVDTDTKNDDDSANRSSYTTDNPNTVTLIRNEHNTEQDSEEKTGSGKDDDDSENRSSNNNSGKPGSSEVKNKNVATTEHNEEKPANENNDEDNNSANGGSSKNISKPVSGSSEVNNNVDTTEHNSDEKPASENDNDDDDSANGSSSKNISKPVSGSTEVNNNVDTTEQNSEETTASENDDDDDNSVNGSSSKNDISKPVSGSLEANNRKYIDTTEHNSEEKTDSENDVDNDYESSNASRNSKHVKPKRAQGETTVNKGIVFKKKVTGLKGGKGNAKNYIQKQLPRSDGNVVGGTGIRLGVQEDTRAVSGTGNNNGVLNTQPQFSRVSLNPYQRRPTLLADSKHWFPSEKQDKPLSWSERLERLSKISNVYV